MKISTLLIMLGLICPLQSIIAFEGFYMGGGLGASLTEGNQQGETIGISFETVVTAFALEQTPSQTFIQGNLYAGYGALWRSLYLGGEAFVQFNSGNMDTNAPRGYTDIGPEKFQVDTSTRMQVNTIQYGFDLRPGWAVTPLTLLYGRVGIGRAQLKLKTKNSYNLTEMTELGSLSLDLAAHRTSPAFRLGLGVEHHLTPRLTMRGDYIFTNCGNLSVSGNAAGLTLIEDTITLNNTTQVHLQQHAVLLGLSYYFSKSYLDYGLAPCCTPLFQGLYLGGALGGFIAKEKITIDGFAYQPFFIGSMLPLLMSPHLINHNGMGMVFLGYGLQWQRLFLGGEIFGQASVRHSLRNKERNNLFVTFATETVSVNTALSMTPLQGGIDLRPGVCITPFTLLYGRIGTAAALLKAKTQASFAGNFSTIWNIEEKQSKQHTVATLRLGGGIEQALFPHLHLRFDYCFTNYGKMKLQGATSGFGSDGLPVYLNYTNEFHLVEHSALFGLSYYFN